MWIDKTLGDLGGQKSYPEYRARTKKLTAAYREASLALERHLMNMGPSSDSAALIAMLRDLADPLEACSAGGIHRPCDRCTREMTIAVT